MAEFAVVASIIQIADVGLRLSTKLYTIGQIVSNADKGILSISKEVSLTSSVLKEFSNVLRANESENSACLSATAMQTADDVVSECRAVFQEMETLLVKKVPNLSVASNQRGSRPTLFLEKLRWPYLQPKMRLLQSNLDRLKATLILMSNVVTYANQISARDEVPDRSAEQRALIEELDRSRQECVRTFERMKLSIETKPHDQSSAIDPELAAGPKPEPQTLAVQTPEITTDSRDLNIRSLTPDSSGSRNQFRLLGPHEQGPGFKRAISQFKHYLELNAVISEEIFKPKYSFSDSSRTSIQTTMETTIGTEMELSTFTVDWKDCLEMLRAYEAVCLESADYTPVPLSIRRRLDPSSAISNKARGGLVGTWRSRSVRPVGTNSARRLSKAKVDDLSELAGETGFEPEDSGDEKYSSMLPGAHIQSPLERITSSQTPQDVGIIPRESLALPITVSPHPPNPQCWEHACNGRRSSTEDSLLRHQRKTLGNRIKRAADKWRRFKSRSTSKLGSNAKQSTDGHILLQSLPISVKAEHAPYTPPSLSIPPSQPRLITYLYRPPSYQFGTTQSSSYSPSDVTGPQGEKFEDLRNDATPSFEDQQGSKTHTGNVVDDLVALWTTLPKSVEKRRKFHNGADSILAYTLAT